MVGVVAVFAGVLLGYWLGKVSARAESRLLRERLTGLEAEKAAQEAAARLAGEQGSHQMAALAACNALLVVPEDQTRVEVGERVLALLLERRGR